MTILPESRAVSARLPAVIDAIDAHQHFWNYNPTEYGWIGPGPLRRAFLPDDLRPLLDASQIDGCIAVEARNTAGETDWLLELARNYAFIRGVVGWAPLTEDESVWRPLLEGWHGNHKLRGIRVGAQGQPDGFLLRPDLNRGIAALGSFGLAFDLLLTEEQLPDAIALVNRHPDQIFVLDHLAKPRVKEQEQEPWAGRLRDLARRPHVFCKLSGLVTEADHLAWQNTDLHFYLQTALEAFGPDRLLFGSDWPVCLLASPYDRWANTVRDFCACLSQSEQAQVWGGTAVRAYGLPHLLSK